MGQRLKMKGERVLIKRITAAQIAVFLFSVLPIVDSVNGIFVSKGWFSFGTLYKPMLAVVLLWVLLKNKTSFKKAVVVLALLSGYLGLIIGINVGVLSEKLISTSFPVKLFFNIALLLLLIECVRKEFIKAKDVYSILNANAWLMICAILLPYVLGMGEKIYSGGIGYKGFFFSNNELTVAQMILFYFSLYRLGQSLISFNNIKEMGVSFIQTAGMGICVLLLNTKAGMVACAAGIVVLVGEYLLRRGAKFKIWIIGVIVVGLFLMKDFILAQIRGFLDRQNYLFTIYDGSALDTILSGRTILLEKAWDGLVSSPNVLFQTIFGNGFCSDILVEMDFLDLFFYLGVIGLLGVVIALVVIFCSSVKNFMADKSIVRPFSFVLLTGYSFLAGHVLFMATAGCYFVLICILDLTYKPEERK